MSGAGGLVEVYPGARPVLSVVVIGRNVAATLARSLESALVAGARLGQPYEVIYVDSASEDGSVEVAARYPVTVLRIAPGEWRCPAAGRALGAQHARGRFVAFLDGDMICHPDWFACALAYLADPQVGVVGGNIFDVIPGEDGRQRRVSRKFYRDATPTTSLSGASVASRAALDASGGFDPYLIACEEKEFALRVQAGGFQAMGVPRPMADHLTEDWTGQQEIYRRRRNGYYRGYGQALKRTWNTPGRLAYLAYIKVPLAFAAGLLLWIALMLAALVSRKPWPALTATLGAAGTLALFSWRLKGLRQGVAFALSQLFVAEGLLRGLLMPIPREPYRPHYARLRQGIILVSAAERLAAMVSKK